MTSSTLLSRGGARGDPRRRTYGRPAAMAQPADDGPSVRDPARANVYVPPSPDTATSQGQRWLKTHPATQDLPDANETANVYVPAAQGLSSALDSSAPTQTVAHAAVPSADGGASPWAVIGVALGCAALLGGAGVVLVHRARRTASRRVGARGEAPIAIGASPRRGLSGLRTRGRTRARAAHRSTRCE
jgi:hypothetical protein